MRSIKTGIVREDDWYEIEIRLKNLPSELRNLYSHMWASCNEDNQLHRAEAAKYFKYMLCSLKFSPKLDRCRGTITIADLALAIDETLTVNLLHERSEVDSQALIQNRHQLEKRVRNRSAGLLEIRYHERFRLEDDRLSNDEKTNNQSGRLNTLGQCARADISFHSQKRLRLSP